MKLFRMTEHLIFSLLLTQIAGTTVSASAEPFAELCSAIEPLIEEDYRDYVRDQEKKARDRRRLISAAKDSYRLVQAFWFCMEESGGGELLSTIDTSEEQKKLGNSTVKAIEEKLIKDFGPKCRREAVNVTGLRAISLRKQFDFDGYEVAFCRDVGLEINGPFPSRLVKFGPEDKDGYVDFLCVSSVIDGTDAHIATNTWAGSFGILGLGEHVYVDGQLIWGAGSFPTHPELVNSENEIEALVYPEQKALSREEYIVSKYPSCIESKDASLEMGSIRDEKSILVAAHDELAITPASVKAHRADQ